MKFNWKHILILTLALVSGYGAYRFLGIKKYFDKATTTFVPARFINELSTPPASTLGACPYQVSVPQNFKLHMRLDSVCGYQHQDGKSDVALIDQTELWQELWSWPQMALAQHPHVLAEYNKLADPLARLLWLHEYLANLSTTDLISNDHLTAIKLSTPFRIETGEMQWQRVYHHGVITSKTAAKQSYWLFFPDARVLKVVPNNFTQEHTDQLFYTLTHH